MKNEYIKNHSISSIEELTHNFEADVSDVEKTTSLLTAEENEEIHKDNIWSFTIINVVSSTVCLVCIFLLETINLSFVGHTKESKINLEAIGIGNIFLNFTSLFLVFGALGGLDTVGSFCFGRKDIVNLGLYTVRMRIIVLICFFFLSVPSCLYTEEILRFLGITGTMAHRSANYTFNMLPSVFFIFNFNLNVRYLQVMQDYFWVSLIAISVMIFHYLANLVAFEYYSSEYIIVAYVTNLSSGIAFVLSSLYIIFFNKFPESFFFFHEKILNLREFIYFLKLCMFSSLQHYGDFIGYEVVTFLGVYLPIEAENSASLVLLNYSIITAYFYSGSSFPLGQLVGYCLGKNDEDFYKFICWTYAKLNLVVGLSLTIFTVVFSKQILYFYTNNETIQVLATPILYLYSFFSLVDNFNVMFQSILRGSGKQHIPSIWNIAVTITITIPVSYILAFPLEFGVIGLWIGIFCFMCAMFIISAFYSLTMNFHENAEKIHNEIHQGGIES